MLLLYLTHTDVQSVTPNNLTQRTVQYGVDQTRFFLMAEVSFGGDGDFSNKSFIQKVNVNLANELGNLCQRTLSMVFKNCNKETPTNVGPFTEADEALLASARGLRERAATQVASQALHKYADEMVSMVWDTNKYIDTMEPWALKKTDTARMGTVLYVIMEVLRHVAILYQPIIPTSSNKILDLLSVPSDERTFAHLTEEYMIRQGVEICKPQGIFPRIEVEEPVEA
jgi:methionyl-tRNA synthetase